MKHFGLNKIAREKAMMGWGVKSKTKESAMKALGKDESVEGALLEIVRRMNQAILAWSRDENKCEEEEVDNGPPEYAERYPDFEIGQIVFSCSDLDDAIRKGVVFSKDDNGYVRVVWYDMVPNQSGQIYLSWGHDIFTTAEDAAKNEAENDARYYGQKLNRAKKILAAIKKDQDFQHFLGDVDEILEPTNTPHSPAATSPTEPGQ